MNNLLTALAILVPFAISGIVFSFVSPVYPLLANSRNVPSLVQGLFFSFFAVPQLLVFAYIPSMERKCGVKNIYFSHSLICAISVFLLSGLHYIHSPLLFSIWGLFFRLLTGIGEAAITYQSRTLARRLLPSHFALLNEVSYATLSIACAIGPVISAPINASYGFHVVCFIVAFFALLSAIQVFCTLPANKCEPVIENTGSNGSQINPSNMPRQGLSYFEFLFKPRVFTSFLLVFLSFFLGVYLLPFISLELSG